MKMAVTHVFVVGEECEGFMHLILRDPAANVQEISRLSSIQLHYIHGCHGESRAIYCKQNPMVLDD